MTATNDFNEEARMNEAEYEKSIAEPSDFLTVTDSLGFECKDQLKAEREFSRGVWEHVRFLRRQHEQQGGFIEHLRGIAGTIIPITDHAPAPKPPDHRSEKEFVEVEGAIHGNYFSPAAAADLIEQIKGRTKRA